MALINPTLPNDGETIDASDVSTPVQAILGVLNGGIDTTNITPGSLAWSVMQTLAAAIPVDAMQDAGNLRISRSENGTNHVASGLVWTADSAGASLNGSMTSGVVYINGRRITISAVTAHAFSASKDTYVYVTDNLDGTGSIAYSEASNNAASPAMASNSILIAIVITAAGSIAAAASINQGSLAATGPTVSSVILRVFDSLGNPIYPTSALSKVLGFAASTIDFTTNATIDTLRTGLTAVCIAPTAMNVKVRAFHRRATTTSGSANTVTQNIYLGAVGSGTIVASSDIFLQSATVANGNLQVTEGVARVAAGSNTFNVSLRNTTAANTTWSAQVGADYAYLLVEAF